MREVVMSETSTPKPGEVWETDEDQKPVRLLGYTAESVDTLHAKRAVAIARAEAAESALKAEQENWLAKDLPTIAEREPWRVLRAAERIMADDGQWASPPELLRDTADRLEREHSESAKRDRLIEKLADILGDFAVADEHSGERNDVQLARLLVGRGVTLAEAVDQ